MRLVAAVAACGLALAGCGAEESPDWNHNPSDAERGPVAWGDLDESYEQCRTGRLQSPIDIARAVRAELPALRFEYPATEFVVENTGHTIEASPDSNDLTVTVAGDVFELLQFHVHVPSEHTRDGRAYAAEVHFVHQSEDGRLSVVAVFVEADAAGSPLLDAVLESAPKEAGEEVELDGEWSPLSLLAEGSSTSATVADYDTYEGSLTTPGCTESVQWNVLARTTPALETSIDRMHQLVAAFPGYLGYASNSRPTQPLSRRVVERDRR
jgi:carbonic anhydrase